MVALLLLLTSALPALQTNKKAVTRRNNLVPLISLETLTVSYRVVWWPIFLLFVLIKVSATVARSSRAENKLRKTILCSLPASHFTVSHLSTAFPFTPLSLTPTSAGFINTFSYGNKQSHKTSPTPLPGPDRIFSCWTQWDQHFAHLEFLCSTLLGYITRWIE